jgi:nicotinate-nucleotide adenylyltransferase
VRLGILGGTFNPIHRAHLRLAETALRALPLDRVLFVPAGEPPLKRAGLAPARDRLAMVRLAVQGRPEFEVDDLELRRRGPSYTVDTLAELRRRHPRDELWFICGADALADLEAWHAPERLFELASFAAAARPGLPDAIDELLPPRLAADFRPAGAHQWVHRSGNRLRALPFESTDVSATRIRARVAAGEPIDDLVPEAVARYIEQHQLYREAA